MKTFEVELTKPIQIKTVTVEARDARDAAKAATESGWNVEAVDDRSVVGTCEGCMEAIFEGESYAYDGEDGIYLCGACNSD